MHFLRCLRTSGPPTWVMYDRLEAWFEAPPDISKPRWLKEGIISLSRVLEKSLILKIFTAMGVFQSAFGLEF